jgi:hypothetical protein
MRLGQPPGAISRQRPGNIANAIRSSFVIASTRLFFAFVNKAIVVVADELNIRCVLSELSLACLYNVLVYSRCDGQRQIG